MEMFRRRHDVDPSKASRSTPELGAAVKAIRKSEEDLRHVRSLWPRVNAVSAQLARELEENDFAGRFGAALGRVKP
jgi:hypothetical protein